MNISKDNKTNNQEPRNVSITAFILVIFLVIFIQIIGGILIYFFIDDWNKRASFGDMFGAINTLFAGLAFAGVIYAILLQRRELELQRYELRMTREELKRSAEAQEKSEVALNEQSKALALTAKANLLNLIPGINFNILTINDRTYSVITNVGNMFAFDVNVKVVGIYYQEDITLEDFFIKYVHKKFQADMNLGIIDDHYSIHHVLSYPLFPSKQRVTSLLYFPIAPSVLYILLQFRDIQGNNYHQFCYLEKGRVGDGKYIINSLDPKIPEPSSRIIEDFDDKLKTDDDTPFPQYIDGEFLDLWNIAIPGTYTIFGLNNTEVQDEWLDQ